MNWPAFTQARRRPVNRCRPRLDALEDRTLLTTATFTLQPSALNIAGSRIVYGHAQIPISEQAPGSFTTTFEGTIATDIDPVGHTITFVNDGGNLTADISGTWQPGVGGANGSAPANYGGQFRLLGTNYAAIRDLVMGLTQDSMPLTRAGFDPNTGIAMFSFPSTQTITIANGNFDYATALFGNDSQSAAGLSGSNQTDDGTLQVNGDGTLTLSVPIDADVLAYDLGNGDGAWIHYNGTLVGTGSLGTSPAVGSFKIISANTTLSNPLGASSGQPDGIASGNGSSIADSGDFRSPVRDRYPDGATVLPAHHASPVSVDAVFQDPLTSTGLPF
jgi:hypothetical protein